MSSDPAARSTPDAAVEAYRQQVLDWLWRRANKWAHTARTATGAAADAASFYAAAYTAAAEGITAHDPEQRAIIEETAHD